jgi:hypothetical protein
MESHRAPAGAQETATYDYCERGHIDPIAIKETSYGRFCVGGGCGARVHSRPIDQAWYDAMDEEDN